ncbi:MAG TPA: gluconate 2-dehydrogenase subunit 3 family protein [Gammaproteobacteria bacterium]
MNRREWLQTAAALLGGSLGASCTRALLSGAPLTGAPARPALDAAQLDAVARAAELIIPTTDTPGAIAAGVPDFIHHVVADWYTREERARFLDGLDALDREARRRYGTDFLSADEREQTALLEAFEAEALSGRPRAGGQFFAMLKELTVLGYYTSEVGCRTELVYLPVPGEYHGDALFHAHDRQRTY